ncbi:uncharacterized protein LOC130725052 [Lotus japonicus]|uniref:uncharacterized protein LOC130725052 n=1 Tax=Lotus japonicus TaxID=34305 RepID=UPI00258C40D0|nr:uncharacterized protein LOC130725052 [Lotus japonicus]
MGQFNQLSVHLEDKMPEICIAAFELGLKPGGLNNNLSRKPVETMAHLRERVQGYIREEQSDRIKNNRPNAAVTGQKQQFEAKKGAVTDQHSKGWTERGDIGYNNRNRYDSRFDNRSHFKNRAQPWATNQPDITFTVRDFEGVQPHEDDPIVVMLTIAEHEIERVLLDQGSSADLIYGDAFEKLGLTESDLQPYDESLVGFSGEKVFVRGYVELSTIFGEGKNVETFVIKFLVVKCTSPYNVLIGRPSLNRLGAIISTRHLTVKYPLSKGGVGVLMADQIVARKCYSESFKQYGHMGKKAVKEGHRVYEIEMNQAEASLDPHDGFIESKMTSEEETKVVAIGERNLKVGTSLSASQQDRLVKLLDENMDFFAWSAKDLPGIDPFKHCPKDSYPLPNIDKLVDRASGFGMLSLMDAYSGYHQIRMYGPDEEKTAFMTNQANYCYQTMPFGLKNAGATYQRLMDKVFDKQVGRNMEIYVDDMVVKSDEMLTHCSDLREAFGELRKHNMRLNPEKCSFGIQSGMFLGFMITRRGIEANPDKCKAIIEMQSPTSVKDVQKLMGRIAALARFLPCFGNKSAPFFQCLRKNKAFQWTEECEVAFQSLKEHLSKPPILSKPVPFTVNIYFNI